MQPNRPTSVLVIAIFHFIFGGYGLLCGLFALGGQALGGAGGNPFAPPAGAAASPQQQELQDFQKKIEERGRKEAPVQQVMAPAIVVVSLLLSLLLIVAGVGLVQVKPYGWWGSVGYGAASLLMQIFSLLYNLLYMLPISQRILEEELKSHPTLAPVAGFMQMIGPLTVSLLILGMIYPVIVLIVMSRPTVRAAFRGEAAPGTADDYADPHGRTGRPPDGMPYPPGYGHEPDDRIAPSS